MADPTITFISMLIIAGAAVMLVNIFRFRKTFRMLKQFELSDTQRLWRLGRFHQILMIFFLFGYLAVAFATIAQAPFVSEIFVGMIFFLGAIFVWLGILLQHMMISMIQRRYDQARQANNDLEREHERLERANRLLTDQMAERRRAERALKESERRIHMILDQLPAGVLVIHEESRTVKEANPAALNMIGLIQEEVIGASCHSFICPLDREEGWTDSELAETIGRAQRMWLQTSDEKIPVLNTVSRIHLEGSSYLLQSFIDLSDKERLEAQLRRAQKMEALGTMAGGVAHDLNNILSGIVSYPELLLIDLPDGSPLRRPIQTIKKSGEKAVTIVRDLLTLARRGVEIKEVINLDQVLREYFDSPQHQRLKTQHPQVSFYLHIQKGLFNILGSPVHLFKTIMNLVNNGAEAMPGGGTMNVSAENRYVDRPMEGYDHVEEGDYVVATFRDTGQGITVEDRDQIFEPFYTSKKLGHSGSGLGMSVVWGTVKDHKGYILVESTPGRGATFTLFFPATRQQIVADDPLSSLDRHMGRGETVLVVDDVEVQRELASDMLGKLGYEIHTVPSGEDAVAYLREHTVDLVILDMIMSPGISGLSTYRQILEIHPRQRAILVSGFSETRDVQKTLELGAGVYIRKPYSLETIASAVRRELKK